MEVFCDGFLELELWLGLGKNGENEGKEKKEEGYYFHGISNFGFTLCLNINF